MQLKEIDKTRYRRHLNVVFAGIAVALMILSLGASTLYIHLLSNSEAPHFFHNLAGVVTAAGIVIYALNKLRSHPFMFEVVYVWDLKQQLNRIHRKQRKIEAAVDFAHVEWHGIDREWFSRAHKGACRRRRPPQIRSA